MTRFDFQDPATTLVKPFYTFKVAANLEQNDYGLHLWCRDGAGAGFMRDDPRQYGDWAVRCKITAGLQNPSTKVCLLLWPDGTGWPPEIDFNESGDRTRSNQTMHYSSANLMHHSTYPVDQTVFHTYGVRVEPATISYFCDGVLRTAVANEAPGVNWNLHVRTQPNLDTVSETKLDVRWIEIPA